MTATVRPVPVGVWYTERARAVLYLIGTPLDDAGVLAVLHRYAGAWDLRVVDVFYDRGNQPPPWRRPGLCAALDLLGCVADALVMDIVEYECLAPQERAWLDGELQQRGAVVRMVDVAGALQEAEPVVAQLGERLAAQLTTQPRIVTSTPEGFNFHPAGADTELAAACTEVQAGRFGFAQELLASTGARFGLRAHRSLVLALFATRSGAADRWVREQPASAEAQLVYARVAVLRALRAAADGHVDVTRLAVHAAQACARAADLDPGDPTPYIALLMLAQHRLYDDGAVPNDAARHEAARGRGRAREHRRMWVDLTGRVPVAGPESLGGLPGPWDLFAEVRKRDPYSREGYLRLLGGFLPRHGGSLSEAWHVAQWAMASTPESSDPQLLELHVAVEKHRQIRNGGVGAAAGSLYLWHEPAIVAAACRVFDTWFRSSSAREPMATADLSLLAYVLVRAEEFARARAVFDALAGFASREPWAIDGDPANEIGWAHQRCQAAPG